MVFSKNFPKQIKNNTVWKEIFLTGREESEIEETAKKENNVMMKECIYDAEIIAADLNLKRFQSNVIDIAISLFEKRASHVVFWKENRCKEKFFKK